MSDPNNSNSDYPNSPFRSEELRTSSEGLEGERIVSKETPLSHYKWGEQCSAWCLVDESSLSIKLEHMPPFTAEKKHFHEGTQQFFFILKGKAVVEIEDQRFLITANHGIRVKPQQQHKIINESDIDLEFILYSQPSAAGDRIDCE